MKRRVAALSTWLLLTVPLCVFGQTVTVSGRTAFVPLSSETIEIAEGHSFTKVNATGIVMTDNPDALINNSSASCSWTTDNTSGAGAGYCDNVDLDGDLWWNWIQWTVDGAQTFGFLGGTGKFEGIEGNGTYGNILLPDGKIIVPWEITYELK